MFILWQIPNTLKPTATIIYFIVIIAEIASEMYYSSLLVITKIYRKYKPSGHDHQETTEIKNLETDTETMSFNMFHEPSL
jgi:1,4-dihydroxy-2-naphthoate octaprenyltransferase